MHLQWNKLLLLSIAKQLVKLDFYYFNAETDADFVYIYDGMNESAPIMVRLSGTYCTTPGSYVTTQRYMFVRFTSNGDTNFDGFGATYSTAVYGKRNVYLT